MRIRFGFSGLVNIQRQLGNIRREPTNAPFGESGEPLANTSIAEEMREEHRRRVLRAVSGKRDHSGHTQMHNPERSHSRSCCADGRELWACNA